MDYVTSMKDPENVLEIQDLETCFFTHRGQVRAVDGVSFSVPAGEIVGIVGESGCGKSVTGLSLMGLLQKPHGKVTGGQLRLNMGACAYDLTRTPEKVLRSLRGSTLSMIFQEPMTALNPVLSIYQQLSECIRLHDPKADPRRRCRELLHMVGLTDAGRILKLYPHNLSGGQRQRICIAMAVSCHPRLVIADEPTTALDVTVQAQILLLLQRLSKELGTAVMLITHDLGVVAGICQRVVVMYAGKVVEEATVEELFHAPAHPYTQGLLRSKPVLGSGKKSLFYIPGTVPDPALEKIGCPFRERCAYAMEKCAEHFPETTHLSPTHRVCCHREGAAL